MPRQTAQSDPSDREPGPGRSTSQAAFDEIRKEIARRNELTFQVAKKLRAKRDREARAIRRERDAI